MNRPKVVLLGMLTKMPFGGVIWLIHQYAVGFERLGFDVYYVEAHGQYPTNFMADEHDKGTRASVAFLADVMGRFGMSDRWAFHALHDDDQSYGLSVTELRRLYRDAALIINVHGGTVPTEEQAEGGSLVYLGTDPVQLELELYRGEQQAFDFLEPHVAFFTWGLNYGKPDCTLPWCERFNFVPSPPPVVLDLWQGGDDGGAAGAFTTVGNWRQHGHDVTFQNEVYTWSKHHEFLKVIALPQRVEQEFELALGRYDDDDRRLLEHHGWRVRSALEVSADPVSYRDYIRRSRGEFTAAKDQNVRFRTGWFSERSATYLASGRPVIQQDTGFGNAIPTGEGVFAFSGLDDAAAAVEEINSDYPRHRRAAQEIARDYFSYDVVLGDMLDHVGLEAPRAARRPHVSKVEAALAELRTAVASMSESLRLREAELATLLGEMGSAGSGDSKRMRYMKMLSGVRAVVEACVPPAAGIAVVSKGGDDLLRFPGRAVQCVPQDGRGESLSFHPEGTLAAVAQAEVARWRGADYFVIPQWSAWWLEAYPGLGAHLDSRYRKVHEGDAASIWSLCEPSSERVLTDAMEECEYALGRPPVILDWDAGVGLETRFPHSSVCAAQGDVLPFLDGTIDVVALTSADEARIREAERVASMAVAVCGAAHDPALAGSLQVDVRWTDRRPGPDPMVSIVLREQPGTPVTPRSVAMLVDSLPAYVASEILLVRAGGRGSSTPPVPVTAYTSLLDAGRAAKGETVVVLDSSTVVLPGWLPALLRTFRSAPAAAVVCGMILEADGALSQPAPAGSSAYEIDAPPYHRVRRVDTCLDTLLAVQGDLFSDVVENPYARDAIGPAAAAARGANRSVVYQPEAVAVRLQQMEDARHG